MYQLYLCLYKKSIFWFCYFDSFRNSIVPTLPYVYEDMMSQSCKSKSACGPKQTEFCGARRRHQVAPQWFCPLWSWSGLVHILWPTFPNLVQIYYGKIYCIWVIWFANRQDLFLLQSTHCPLQCSLYMKSTSELHVWFLANSFLTLNSVLNKENVLFLFKSIKFKQMYQTWTLITWYKPEKLFARNEGMQSRNDLYTGRTLDHYILYYVQERIFLVTFEVQNRLKWWLIIYWKVYFTQSGIKPSRCPTSVD